MSNTKEHPTSENGPNPDHLSKSGSPTGTIEHSAPAKTLLDRIIQGSGIAIAGFGLSQIIRLGSNLIMVRLLPPETFGLLAITISLQVLMMMLSDIGLNQSLVRSKSGNDPAFLSTIWVVQIVRGALLAAFLVVIACAVWVFAKQELVPLNSVFNDPRLPIFIAVSAIAMLIDGTKSVKFATNQRDLHLGRLTLLEIICQILGLIIMLLAYHLGAGAYSLLINLLSVIILTVVGSHVFLNGPKIKLEFHKHHFQEIFHFGKWLLIASFFGFIIQRGDQFIFGTILDSTNFGLYAIAAIWITIAIALIDAIQTRVAYPAISEVWRDTPQNITKVYGNFRLAIDSVCLVIFLGIHLASDFVFNFLYPEDYGNVTYYLGLLSVIVVILPFRLLNSVILAIGHSQKFLVVTIAPTLMIIIGVPVVYSIAGIKAAIVFGGLANLPAVPISWYFIRDHVKLSPIRELPMAVLAIVTAITLIWT